MTLKSFASKSDTHRTQEPQFPVSARYSVFEALGLTLHSVLTAAKFSVVVLDVPVAAVGIGE